MRQRGLLALTALGLALTGAALASLWRQPPPLPAEGTVETLADYGPVPDFGLTERGGSTVTLAGLRGKVWLANFVLVDRRARIRAYQRIDDRDSIARLRSNLRALLAGG